eukprot:Phypoly_transcript_26378.p1 GENE.Phypoly_transcript_26378~~Phypoly_transcript_26378.p1  ORF type:complete len:157 (-),score=28.71 Phypoly_transcript_26378:30-431(-)
MSSTLSLLLCFSLLLGCVFGQGKLLIHVDDTTLADEAAANIVNYFRANPTASVVAVFNSVAPILFAVPNNSFIQEYEQIINAYPKDFSILLCNNSINALNIPLSAFPDFVTVVPAAISSLVQYQNMGYAYVKP